MIMEYSDIILLHYRILITIVHKEYSKEHIELSHVGNPMVTLVTSSR